MKIGTITFLILAMITFVIFFSVIDPLVGSNRLAALLIYIVLFLGLRFFTQKLEDRFEFLQKKLDGQLAVLLVIAILTLPFFLSMV